jgi:hypothetical protein
MWIIYFTGQLYHFEILKNNFEMKKKRSIDYNNVVEVFLNIWYSLNEFMQICFIFFHDIFDTVILM